MTPCMCEHCQHGRSVWDLMGHMVCIPGPSDE